MPLGEILRKRGPIRRIGVIGMGYVGIPSAVLFAAVPHYQQVVGFQRDSPSSGYKIAMLNRGESPLKGEEPELGELLKKVVDTGKFVCSSDYSLIGEADVVTIAIQTPFRNPKDLIPDYSALIEGIRMAGRNLTEGTLVVLESTVTPGTTTGLAREVLEEESDMKAGEDFALAHAPERVMVGRLLQNLREHDRVVGGIDEASTTRAIDLYSPLLTKGMIIPMSATAAEITKTAENTFRDLQIAAVNELALYCEAMGVNIYDIRRGIASLKGEGITRAILWPGAGVGGHCLIKDTYHLERGVRTLGAGKLDYPEGRESLYVLARCINDFMPLHMAHLTRAALARVGKTVDNSTVAILGWAFIADSDDARNPPAEVYRNAMLEGNARVKVHDPYVKAYAGVEILHDIDEALEGTDAVAIFTGHSCYLNLDPVEMRSSTGSARPVVIDGRNVINPDSFITNGWIYQGIGRGDKNNHPLR